MQRERREKKEMIPQKDSAQTSFDSPPEGSAPLATTCADLFFSLKED